MVKKIWDCKQDLEINILNYQYLIMKCASIMIQLIPKLMYLQFSFSHFANGISLVCSITVSSINDYPVYAQNINNIFNFECKWMYCDIIIFVKKAQTFLVEADSTKSKR